MTWQANVATEVGTPPMEHLDVVVVIDEGLVVVVEVDGGFVVVDGGFVVVDGGFVEVDGGFVEVEGGFVEVEGGLLVVVVVDSGARFAIVAPLVHAAVTVMTALPEGPF